MFQFQTGSIKRIDIIEVNTKNMTFQFQTGSIKSTSDSINKKDTLKFQFQTGSIKSPLALTYLLPANMFQLKADADFDIMFEEKSGFNSKLVRLKVSYRLLHRCLAVLFQFQTGSIKRLLITQRSMVASRCFNSKLVRLKVKNLIIRIVASDTVSIPNWFD